MTYHTLYRATALIVASVAPLSAEPLITPGDPVVPFDEDAGSSSNYPAGEAPAQVIDGDANTKYLNFARQNSGFIVTPVSGSSIVKSLQVTTANDAAERDPIEFELFGTNETILSTDNSSGAGESWVPIGTGTLALPADRLTVAPAVNVTNGIAYTSYRFVVRTLKGPGENSMQVAEVQLYTEEDATGAAILAPGDPIFAIHLASSESNSPAEEEASFAIDGLATTKYLNFGKQNAGFIVTPSKGVSVAKGFTVTTANDSPERDPADWELLGTNDAITSEAHGTGVREVWTSIATGTLALPDTRDTAGPAVTFANTAAYTSYKFVVRTLKDTGVANSLQFAEIQFDGELGLGTPLEITSIVHDVVSDTFTITWRSEPGKFYSVFYSTDLINWDTDLEDGLESQGDFTSFGPFLNPGLELDPVPDRGFFRALRNIQAP